MFEPIPATYAQRERYKQALLCLQENGVMPPYIVWITGKSLDDFLSSIGVTPHFRDGPIIAGQLYRYNLTTKRFRKAEPRQ